MKDTSKRTCYTRKNKELFEEKAETGVKGGVLALKTETLLQKGKNKHRGSRRFHIFSHNSGSDYDDYEPLKPQKSPATMMLLLE